MATQPQDNPGDTPDEIPTPEQPGFPGGPDESEPASPDVYQPDSAPIELPPPD
ncbi:hypothetical protein WSK_2627 [Novosphingobium sp. Rr 2-17]|uniref:hypothetical protein n=1 Tax=Novosphingobium sp. Rr 2-17 TaxID=555793 RepID=UPI000269854C|nr:hypothetical protein [Novosphingobium sp. Rr 2-17]EIZ78580.1 hypothetical protein WSK_2627 [Novosphingobium sp. Rr 2-17]